VSRIVACGLDIETTGLEQDKGHRMVEVATLLYDVETEALLAKWVQRINPQRAVPGDAVAVHGITFEAVSGEPTFEVIAPKLAKILSTVHFVVGHNGRDFDLPFIRAELIRVGQPAPNPPVIDTSDAKWATPFGKTPSLGELCFALGIAYDKSQAHSAEYDVDVMMKAFFAGKRMGYFALPELRAAA